MNFFVKFTKGLRARLILTALIPLTGFAIISSAGFSAFKNISIISDEAYSHFIPSSQNIGQLLENSSSMAYFMWAAYGTYDDEKVQKSYVINTKKHLSDYEAAFNEYSNSKKSSVEDELFTKIAHTNLSFIDNTKMIIDFLEKNQPDTREKAVKEITSGLWAKQNQLNRSVYSDILKYYKEQAISDREKLELIQTKSNRLIIWGGLLSALLTLAIMVWMSERITRMAIAVSTKLEELGSQVTDAITQLASAGQSLSQSSTGTAASLEETVASLEEISSMIDLNTKNSSQASTLSNDSLSFANNGESEIKQLLASMTDIEAASKKISEIIDVIDDIAFQTNLLALNASVEAARAGEHGKGFAVVADAVRALAQRSAVAAKDISTLIQSTQNQVKNGNLIAQKSGQAMTGIVDSVRKVTTLSNEISDSTIQQSEGIRQVSKAMNQIDSGTQSNAASAEEISATVDDIANISQQMQERMQELNKFFQG